MDIKKRVEQEVPEIIKNLRTLVSYPSVLDEPTEDMPFGKANAECLNAALKILSDYGFQTKNVDNYAGYAEIGSGEKLIGMVGHLDVVPVTEGWTSHPFTLTERGENLYGRGATDDKGPVCCAMAALRIVNELRPDLDKRIRLVMGCNEENGSACLAHYVEKEGHFDLGFTPDGNFPGVYGEKGLLHGHMEVKTEDILEAEGGAAINVVCGKCYLTMKKGSFDLGKFQMAMHARSVAFKILDDGDPVRIMVDGVQAHASLPDMGVNAINEAFAALDEAGCKDPAVRFLARYFGTTCHGERLGIDFEDAYGDLSLNLGIIKKVGDKLHITIDIRFPVTKDPEQMRREFLRATEGDEDGELFIDELEAPLFFPPDSPLVKALYSAYRDITGDTVNKPMVIGGGTYAKGIHNTIAFGAEFPDDPDIHMHGDDEYIPIKNLARQTEIYVHALLNLLDL